MRNILIATVGLVIGGGLLAATKGTLPVQPGWLGVAAMLIGAMIVRRYWRQQHLDDQLASPEHELWFTLASTSMIGGFLGMSLWVLGPQVDLHSRAVHAMAIDVWTLVIGGLLSAQLARDPEPRSDERDRSFLARATGAGHNSLIALLLCLAILLSFGTDFGLPPWSAALIAHLLILAVMASSIVRCGVQLWLYHRDRRLLQMEMRA